MKLFDNVQSGQTRDRMHPELGDPSDPSGLLEHREYCLQKIEDKMHIMMMRNGHRGRYKIACAHLLPDLKMKAIEFATDNCARWEIESLIDATRIDIEHIDSLLDLHENHPLLFAAVKFVSKEKFDIRAMTIRRTLLQEYLNILKYVPDTIDESI